MTLVSFGNKRTRRRTSKNRRRASRRSRRSTSKNRRRASIRSRRSASKNRRRASRRSRRSASKNRRRTSKNRRRVSRRSRRRTSKNRRRTYRRSRRRVSKSTLRSRSTLGGKDGGWGVMDYKVDNVYSTPVLIHNTRLKSALSALSALYPNRFSLCFPTRKCIINGMHI